MNFRWTSSGSADQDGDASGRKPAEKLAAGVPLVRMVSRKLVDSPTLLFRGAGLSPAAERFRRLKAVLTHDPERALQVIIVTSAVPSEGKSFVAMNLALAFAADAGRRTLLIDADLRRPAVNRYITPAPTLGLSEVLEERVTLDHAILQLKDSALEILPAGDGAREPVELLASQGFATLMADLRSRYEHIVIDTPPIVPFTDADVMGRQADGAILVVRQGSTPTSYYCRALTMLTSTRLLGAVLNDSTYSVADRGRYYDEYYDHYYKRDREKR